jgi:hypothetical protein
MSKLLQRLSDASKSGVYRAPQAEAILEATQGSPLRVSRIGLAGAAGKAALLARVAGAMEFPNWFGGNWDALEDCLSDLSWMEAGGHVLLIEGAAGLPADERGIFVDILASAAAAWAERKHPFFAVFVDGPPNLPELYKSHR